MHRLILMRHAQAESAAPSGLDRDRRLAARGRDEALLIGRTLAAKGLRPDLSLVSTATRTRETWELAGLPDVPVTYERAIYDAPWETLVGLARAIPDTVSCAVMVGHNPGFEDFALALDGARAHLRTLPTGGVVVAKWRIDHWRDLDPAQGRLKRAVTPADLREGEGD